MRPTIRDGFTLIEMVVVLAILGIMAAAVVPAFERAITDDPLSAAANRLDQILRDARAKSLQHAVSMRVTLVPASGRYLVLEEGADSTTSLDSGQLELSADLRLSSTSTRPTIRFSSAGMVDGDSLLVLGATGVRAVVIDRWTGTVHVESR